jgi:hypothetical protein
MRRRRKIDDTDYSGRVAATKARIARERLGIPALEAELKRMRHANRTARMMGEDEVFPETVIDDFLSRLRMLESQLAPAR